MQKTTAQQTVISFMNDGYLLTAHQIAGMTGYTPQHINRILKRLFHCGRLAYTTVPHQGRSKFARKWCALNKTGQHPTYAFVSPEYVQMEMFS